MLREGYSRYKSFSRADRWNSLETLHSIRFGAPRKKKKKIYSPRNVSILIKLVVVKWDRMQWINLRKNKSYRENCITTIISIHAETSYLTSCLSKKRFRQVFFSFISLFFIGSLALFLHLQSINMFLLRHIYIYLLDIFIYWSLKKETYLFIEHGADRQKWIEKYIFAFSF